MAGATASLALALTGGGKKHQRHNATHQTAPGPPSPALLASIKTLAFHIAAISGEPSPTNAVIVPSTRIAANEVANGAELTDDSPVYVVSMQGHFTALDAPYGQKPPTGTVLTLTINPTTMEVLDVTISQTVPDLGKLGPVQSLG